jgi:prolyl-tRNA editing enzyme YbaK/EbsC (Cys-tRNA(Pro) deacylase)
MSLEVVKILEKNNVNYKLIRLSSESVNIQDVMNNSTDRINENEICKTIVVKGDKNNNYAILLEGKSKIDFSKLKVIIGSKINIVNLQELRSITGKEPGEICPLLLSIPLFVDERVLAHQNINFGSGDLLYGIEINSMDLERVVKIKIVNVT